MFVSMLLRNPRVMTYLFLTLILTVFEMESQVRNSTYRITYPCLSTRQITEKNVPSEFGVDPVLITSSPDHTHIRSLTD